MNAESLEKTKNQQESEISSPESSVVRKPEDINEMYKAAYKLQEVKDAEKAAQMSASLKGKMDNSLRSLPVDNTVGTEFVSSAVESNKKTISSILRKVALWGTLAGGIFASNHASGQEKMTADKNPQKKEVKITPQQTLQQALDSLQTLKQKAEAFDELSKDEKTDWNTYVAYVNGKNLHDDPRMNTRAFANKVIDDFIHEYNSTHTVPTNMSPDLIPRVQREMAFQRAMAIAEMAVTKANGGRPLNGYMTYSPGIEIGTESENNFMPNLSAFDGIAGPKTLRPLSFGYTEERIKTTASNLKKINTKNVDEIINGAKIEAEAKYSKDKTIGVIK